MEEEKIEIQNKIQEYFGDDVFDVNAHYENFRKNIVTIIAYLIGVDDEKFSYEDRFDIAEYEKLKTNEDATVIRYLCRLRTQFLRNYKNIDNAKKFSFRSLESLTEYLDVEAILYLRERGLEVNIVNVQSPTVNIAYINQYILDNIERIKPLIPDWVKFQYVKSLFLMPGGYAGFNGAYVRDRYQKVFAVIGRAGKEYGYQRNSYPYQMYISWPCSFKETDGNILFNDLKFLKMLYGAFSDKFEAWRYLVDAKSEKKQEVYDFLQDAVSAAVFVDCENVDPYAFGATMLNLDEGMLCKIKKIVLYDDVNTSTAWDYISNLIKIPVVKKDIERLLDDKSLVDITMAVGVCEEYFCCGVDSILLASSDSDFWGLIKQLPQTRFLVLNEYKKTSATVIEALDKNNIKHCYMSDFAQDSIQEFKSDVLYFGLSARVKKFNETGEFETLDVDELLQELFYEASISGAEGQVEKEKEAFFNKYLKNGLLIKPVVEDDKRVFKIEIYKK